MLRNNDVISICRNEYGMVSGTIIPDSSQRKAKSQPLKQVVRHSPKGFQYGYNDPGSADLDLSILTVCVDSELDDRYYRAFNLYRVMPEEKQAWAIKVQQVRKWVDQQTQ